MARRPTSGRWLAEHHSDEYVKRAREMGYRSRAVFKLQELDERYRLIKRGMSIVDLGAAPGGWSQFVSQRLAGNGRIVALDVLPMEAVRNVRFICGDFRDDETLAELRSELGQCQADLILSDMAPNMSGLRAVDVPRAFHLVELAQDLAREVLKPGGGLVVKVFAGTGFDAFLRSLRQEFSSVVVHKPHASRSRSAENYAVAQGFRGGRS